MSKKKNRIRKKSRFNKITIVSGFLSLCAFCFLYIYFGAVSSFFYNVVDKSLKYAGFVLNSINISGTNVRTEILIRNNLKFENSDNIFKFSAKEIHQKVKEVGWVKSAVVKKILPNIINIKIEQKIPVAIFQHDSVFTKIDKNGAVIEDTKFLSKDLPIIAGEYADKEFGKILDLISKYDVIKNKLNSLVFIRKRRWNLFICDGIQVKLPDRNIEEALNILSVILKQKKFNNKNVEIIDLRVKGNTIIKGLKIKSSKNANLI